MKITSIKINAILEKYNHKSQKVYKWDRGQLNVIGGSSGYWGSSIMCAKAGYRVGVGYSCIISQKKEVNFISMIHPELLTKSILSKKNIQKLIPKDKNYKLAFVIGPGFGRTSALTDIIKFFLNTEHISIPVLLDADALYNLSCLNFKNNKITLPSHWILTPHEGELARLINKTKEYVHAHREKSLMLAFQKYNCHILLKGNENLIIEPIQKKIYRISVGNLTLAKAGSGDILAGMIGGLLAQGFASLDAMIIATFWHADFANWYIKEIGTNRTLLSSEIIKYFPFYLRSKK